MSRPQAVIGWLLAMPAALFALLQAAVAFYIETRITATDLPTAVAQARDYAELHAETLRQLDLAALGFGLLLGLAGGLSGRLPGTRRRSVDEP